VTQPLIKVVFEVLKIKSKMPKTVVVPAANNEINNDAGISEELNTNKVSEI
jgi:hypothetical protein